MTISLYVYTYINVQTFIPPHVEDAIKRTIFPSPLSPLITRPRTYVCIFSLYLQGESIKLVRVTRALGVVCGRACRSLFRFTVAADAFLIWGNFIWRWAQQCRIFAYFPFRADGFLLL